MKKKIFINFLLVLFLANCVLTDKSSPLKIYIQSKDAPTTGRSVLVFNFREPSQAPGKGVLVARLFHQGLLAEKKFKMVRLDEKSTWDRLAGSEEQRLENAISEGLRSQCDFILIGEITDYVYGGYNQTRLALVVRIVETRSRKTIFYGSNQAKDIFKDPSYPLDAQLSKPPRTPDQLAEEAVKGILQVL